MYVPALREWISFPHQAVRGKTGVIVPPPHGSETEAPAKYRRGCSSWVVCQATGSGLVRCAVGLGCTVLGGKAAPTVPPMAPRYLFSPFLRLCLVFLFASSAGLCDNNVRMCVGGGGGRYRVRYSCM